MRFNFSNGIFPAERFCGIPLIQVSVLYVYLLIGGIPSTVHASPHDFELWSPIYLTYSFTETLQGWYEVQPRFGDNVSKVDELLLRTALGYRVTKHWSLWQGYAWIPSFVPTFAIENRSYQQLLYSREFPMFQVMSR
ncbi:DUF2490 domain-containing protein, partial [Candidatus Parcubacteria bacterium]